MQTCDACVCNVDSSDGPVVVPDARRILRYSVGQPVELDCPACPQA